MDNLLSDHDLLNITFILSVLFLYIGTYMLLFSLLTKIDHEAMNLAERIIINIILVFSIILIGIGVTLLFI